MTELKRCPFCGGKAVFSIKKDFSRSLIKGYEFNTDAINVVSQIPIESIESSLE